MASDWKEIPAIQDREVSDPAEDRFGHRDLEWALRGLIESKDHNPPYSIGLLGNWGSGKSTVRALYERRLAEDVSRSRRFRPISFNAWRFGREEVKRALLRHLYLELGGNEARLHDEVYRPVQRSSTEERPISEIIEDLKALWKSVGIQFCLLFAAVVAVAVVLVILLGIDTALARSLVIAAAFASLPLLGRYLLNPVPWRANVTRVELPATTAEQYEKFLKTQLARFSRGDSGVPDSASCERLVIFVDDLDRLPAEEMVGGLDAVRGFMDLPRGTSESPGLVFVISCDEQKVAEALADRRRQREPEVPATISGREDARRYLDRIFQFRLEVPPLPKRDMRDFAKRRLEEDLAPVAGDLTDKGYSLDEVIDRMIHPGVQDPRTAVHILNAFCRGWWLAHHRERTGGMTRAGGLMQGAVTNHPQTLAALAALQVGFPEFYDDLEEHPDLLDAFSRVFVEEAAMEDQPLGLYNVLDEYRQHPSDSEVITNEVKPNEVKPEYRGLRTFVAGLRGMRRPANLRPLIELSQDQLSRHLGPREEEIRTAFVDADTRGVLEALGRATDTDTLSEGEIAMLRDVVEETEGETQNRRDNGGVVLAELADRLPDERAADLLSPLASRLVGSRDLRSRVGVGRISELLPRLRTDDRRDTASALVDDLLKTTGDEIELQTESLETPSLDMAIDMVRRGVEAILYTRAEVGLPSSQDALLLGWLTSREVSIDGDSYQIPLSELEDWMDRHESHLLQALGHRYTAMIADAAHRNNTGGLPLGETTRRSTKVFRELAGGGRESWSILWDHLAAFVSAADPLVARTGWEFAAHHETADGEGLNGFVLALADRIEQAQEDPEERDLDTSAAGEALVGVCSAHAQDLSEGAQEKLSSLAMEWSR